MCRKAAAAMAFRDVINISTKVITVCLLGLLAEQVLEVSSVDQDCDYFCDLESGKPCHVVNPDYHEPLSTLRSCRWRAKSSHRVKISCGYVRLPFSDQCKDGYIRVHLSNDRIQIHCGNYWFVDISTGSEMTVIFEAESRIRGEFRCRIQAITREDDNCRCGVKNLARIVGGTESGVNEYPPMVAFLNIDIKPWEILCGGTIISPTRILTAAHCVTNTIRDYVSAVVGAHNLTDGITRTTQVFRIAEVHTNPLYVESAGTPDHDIAIVVIDGVIKYSAEVGPACLPFDNGKNLFVGEAVTALGWGTLTFGGSLSDTLQKVVLPVVPMQVCSQFYTTLTEKQICTFAPGKDSCQHDSGGPCLWMDPVTRLEVVVGVITSGKGCASDAPGVNQRVGAYMDWIIDVTLDEKYCSRE